MAQSPSHVSLSKPAGKAGDATWMKLSPLGTDVELGAFVLSQLVLPHSAGWKMSPTYF